MEYDRAERRRFILWTVIAVVVAITVGWGIWAFTVATSQVRGQGNAIIQKNSAQNWTKAQAEFEDMYAHIEASDRKIVIAKERMDANPGDRIAEDNYYGSMTVCQSQVADYNALARSYTAQDFRSADLPDQIDSRNPTTDCKE